MVALSSIGGAGWQFFDGSGDPLSGGKLYTYLAGTTTPATTYTSNSGSIPNTNPIILDSAGRVAEEIWLQNSVLYKFVLTSSTDVSVWTKDNVPGIFASQTLTADIVTYDPPFTGAVTSGYTAEDKFSQFVSVMDFGAVGDGAVDDTAAFNLAVNYLVSVGGGTLYVPQGTYLLNGTAGNDGIKNGVLLPFNSSGGGSENGNPNTIKLLGASEYTRLLAGSSNMYVIRLSGSHHEISNLRIDANAKTGVTGIGLVPTDTSNLGAFADQSQNTLSKLVIKDCSDAIVLQCGPGTTSTSACYYNHFSDIHIVGGAGGTRGIYFKTGVNSGSLNSTSNRNHFYDIRLNSLNTGILLESGGTNNFYGTSFESVNVGTSPLTTPTALKIDNLDGNGLANEANRFFGGTIEYCTRDIVNANNATELYGLYFDGTKILFTANPEIVLGGYDASVTPQIMPGYVYQQNPILSGFRGGAIQTTFGLSFGASPQSVLNYYQKGTWTPTYKGSTSNPTATYVIQLGNYERIGNLCFISIEIQTSSASGGSGNLQIGDLPFNAAVNSGYPQHFALGLSDGFASDEPKTAFIASNSNRITLSLVNSSNFQTSSLGVPTATVSALDGGVASNRINVTFCYQTV
jgi:hypothetical protein